MAQRGTSRRLSNPETAAEFLDVVRKWGNLSLASRTVGLDPKTVYGFRARHPEFAEALAEALEEAYDRLEETAWRRAVDGVPKPMVSAGKHVCDSIEYSDALLALLLKAHRPERYKDKSSMELSGKVGVTVEVVQFGEDPATS